jgi:dihydropteroate synthase
MGVVNVTPDSFSDGGAWATPDAAIARGLELVGQGADLIDVGGESTRPGAPRVDRAEELRRVLPVVRALAGEGAVVSIDTTRAGVALAAVEAGAVVVNDVSGGRADPEMAHVVAESGVTYVLMHSRARARTCSSSRGTTTSSPRSRTSSPPRSTGW